MVPLLRVVSYVLRSLVGLGALLLGMAIFAALVATRPEPARVPRLERPVRVQTMTARAVKIPRLWEGYGTVRAMDAADVAAQVAARVLHRPARIEPGEVIARDEVLLELDPTDLAHRAESIRQATAAWDAQLQALRVEQRRLTDRIELAEDEVAIAQGELQRLLQAREAGASHENEIDRARLALSRTRGELTALRQRLESLPAEEARLAALLAAEHANLAAAQENLRRATIRSPIDGVLQRVDVRPGEWVSVGQPVARVVDLRRVEIPLLLPVSAFAGVRVGDPVRLRPDTPGIGPDVPGWEGRVERLSPEADPRTRTVAVFVVVEQENALRATTLLPGQFVVGEILAEDGEAHVVVPRRTVEHDRVLVVEPDAEGLLRARSRPVRVRYYLRRALAALDPLETQWAVLEDGLEPGARVILTNLDDLRDGMLVEASAPPPTGRETAEGGPP